MLGCSSCRLYVLIYVNNASIALSAIDMRSFRIFLAVPRAYSNVLGHSVDVFT